MVMQVRHLQPKMFKNVNQQMTFGLLSESESKLPGLEVWTMTTLQGMVRSYATKRVKKAGKASTDFCADLKKVPQF